MSIQMNMKFVSAAESGSMNYAVYYPDHFADLPLLVYLHGAGERGLDYEHMYRHGIPLLLSQGQPRMKVGDKGVQNRVRFSTGHLWSPATAVGCSLWGRTESDMT